MGNLIDERAIDHVVNTTIKEETPIMKRSQKINVDELTKGVNTLEEYKTKIWESIEIPEWLKDARWIVHPAVDIEKTLNIMLNTCWDSAKSRLVVVSTGGSLKYFGRTDAKLAFKDVTVPIPSDQVFLLNTEDNDDTTANKAGWNEFQHQKRLHKFMLEKVIDQRQVDSFSVSIDPWADEVNLIHKNEKRIMHIVLNKLIQKVPKKAIDDSIVEDYKEHFPQLDVILKLVAAFRFGADTKQSYLWHRATSDWGKSFFWQGILGELGLAVLLKEKELKKAFGGDPVGLSAALFTHSWLILFEEFSGAVKELKDITHSMMLAPKFESRTTVELYGKVFLSAENVNSLEDSKGVESQFANRFMKIMSDGSLVNRLKYSNNKMKYHEVILWYVYERLQKEISIYLGMNKYKAADRAEKIQNEFRSTHKISTIDMMDTVHEKLGPYYNKMRSKWRSIGEPNTSYKEDQEIKSMFGIQEDVLYVLQPGKVKEHFMNDTFSRDEQKNLHHKSTSELLLLGKRTKKKFYEEIGYINCYPV